MNHSKALGVGAAILFVALWIAPLVRAVSFCKYANQADDGTLNAHQDVVFSREIFICYLVSIGSSLFMAWLISRRAGVAFLLPVAVLVWKVVGVIQAHPEEVIVLIPNIDPVRFATFQVVVVAVAASFSLFPPRR